MNRLFEGNPSMVRLARMLYILIRQKNGVTRQVLSDQLDLPATSLNRMLDRQVQAGLIEEYDLAVSTGGRRPGLYRLNKTGRFLLGLDWTAQTGCLILADTALQVIARQEWTDMGTRTAAEQAAAMHLSITRLLADQRIEVSQLLGLGVSLPGLSAAQGGLAVAQGSSSGLIGLLETNLGLPVCPVASQDAAFFAGLWQIRESAAESLLYLTIGESVRSGMALNGQLHEGLLVTLPIDHLLVPLPEKSGGQELGQVATLAALTRRFQRSKDDPDLSWADFCRAVKDGKKKARQIMGEAAFAVAAALYDMACLTGSNQILVSGNVVDELPEFEQEVKAASSQIGKRHDVQLKVTMVAGGMESRALGAAAYVLESRLNGTPDTGQCEWVQPPPQHEGPDA